MLRHGWPQSRVAAHAAAVSGGLSEGAEIIQTISREGDGPGRSGRLNISDYGEVWHLDLIAASRIAMQNVASFCLPGDDA